MYKLDYLLEKYVFNACNLRVRGSKWWVTILVTTLILSSLAWTILNNTTVKLFSSVTVVAASAINQLL
jgi:hypothetical protein